MSVKHPVKRRGSQGESGEGGREKTDRAPRLLSQQPPRHEGQGQSPQPVVLGSPQDEQLPSLTAAPKCTPQCARAHRWTDRRWHVPRDGTVLSGNGDSAWPGCRAGSRHGGTCGALGNENTPQRDCCDVCTTLPTIKTELHTSNR